MIFRNNNGKAEEINKITFDSEKEIQNFCEKNLEIIFNLKLVESEFVIANFRFDTLAYDKISNSFVIIEYKNRENYSVIDQGFTYLGTMLDRKADIVLKYNEVFNCSEKPDNFNWKQSKIIFISPNYNTYQKTSNNLNDLPLPMELWIIKKYEYNLLLFEQLISDNSKKSIISLKDTYSDTKQDDNIINKVMGETKQYSEEDVFSHPRVKSCDEIIEIYNELKDYILSLDDSITININKYYMRFNKDRKVLISIVPLKNSLNLLLNDNIENIDDPKNTARNVMDKGHWGVGDSEIKIEIDSDIEYIKYIINKYIEKKLYGKQNKSN